MRRLIVILGPTASGKSALAVRLARRFRGVVISADSRQVYRGLDIGTAKITRREMHGVPHYLLDVASPRSQYSVARYQSAVLRVLKRLPETTPIFLVGGSPFYIKSIIEAGSFSRTPPNPALRRRLAAKSTNQLINQLTKLDRQRAQSIDTANRRRLIRAIEVASNPKTISVPSLPLMRVLKLGLSLPRQKLYQRIDRRIDQRIKHGMIAEVRRLHAQGLSWKRLESFGLEYRWISRNLRGQLTKSEMVDRLKGDTHDFTRRQLTWWRKEPNIVWIRQSSQAIKSVKTFLAV